MVYGVWLAKEDFTQNTLDFMAVRVSVRTKVEVRTNQMAHEALKVKGEAWESLISTRYIFYLRADSQYSPPLLIALLCYWALQTLAMPLVLYSFWDILCLRLLELISPTYRKVMKHAYFKRRSCLIELWNMADVLHHCLLVSKNMKVPSITIQGVNNYLLNIMFNL